MLTIRPRPISTLSAVLSFTLFLMLYPTAVQPSSCSAGDAAMLRQRRLDTLKANILAQLGMSEPPVEPNEEEITTATPSPQNEAVREAYHVLTNASRSLDANREKQCNSQEFYAKPVTSFIGLMSPESLIPVDIVKRQAPSYASGSGLGETGESLPMIGKPGILGSYRITLNFDLSRDLSDISRADLLLYQMPTRTGPGYTITDRKQFVEIRTILESVGERHVVGGKYTELFDSGFKAFDITAAVKLWVLKGITGNAVLEVVIYCYSSPQCSESINGKLPAKIDFLYSSEGVDHGTDKEPRLIVVSKNPLEAELEAKRKKRNSNPDEPVFCSANASTCCLQPLTINFKEDLGLTFIEEPREFQANYCEGYCPELSGLDVMTPQRFQFLRLLGDGSPASSIEPCCTGSAYRPLDVLLNIYNRRTHQYVTIIDQLQQVSVTKCKCA